MSDKAKIIYKRTKVQERMEHLEERIVRAADAGDYLQVEMCSRELRRLDDLSHQVEAALSRAGWVAA